MGEVSSIAWTDATFNPWIGCTKVSPGCDHCYAEAWDRRFAGETPHWGPNAPRRRTTTQNWNKVRRWQRDAAATGRRLKVFCASLADVFDNEVPDEWRADLWALIDECPNLDWIIVTKRVGNVPKMAPAGGFPANVIILSTIVNQAEADRDLDKLVSLKRRGIVRYVGVSYEPALGPVDWSPWLADLDWIIIGGESSQGGAEARLFDLAWARSTIAQCRAAGVAVFTKQLGSAPVGVSLSVRPNLEPPAVEDRAGADPEEWPEDLRVREFPEMLRAA